MLELIKALLISAFVSIVAVGFISNPYVQKLFPSSVDWTWPANCALANLNGFWGDHFVCYQNREKV